MVSSWLRRNAVIVVLAAVAAGIATWAFTRKPPELASQRAIATARARLSACLIGQPVSRESIDGQRLRAIQLAHVEDWPKRCGPYAEEVERALPHHGGVATDDGSRALYGGHVFANYNVNHDVSSLLSPDDDEPILALADVARDVPPPPAPVLLPREVVEVARRSSTPIDVGEHDLGIVMPDEVACRFAARDGGLEPLAHCSYAADALMSERRWARVPSTSATDLALLAADGIRAFATGDRLAAGTRNSQAWEVAGTLYVFPADATRTSVLRRDASGATTTLRLPHHLDESATMVGTQLLWTEHDRVVGVSLDAAKPSSMYEVAKGVHLPEAAPCATADIAAALLVDKDDQARVAVFSKGSWRVTEPGPHYQLSCTGATVTGLDADKRSTELAIERIDCNADRCTHSAGKMPSVTGAYAVAAAGSDTIVVWVGATVVGVEGPIASLATAKPFVIFDGSTYENLEAKEFSSSELVQHVDVFARGASMIVVVSGDGLELVHVRDGKPERVAVTFD